MLEEHGAIGGQVRDTVRKNENNSHFATQIFASDFYSPLLCTFAFPKQINTKSTHITNTISTRRSTR